MHVMKSYIKHIASFAIFGFILVIRNKVCQIGFVFAQGTHHGEPQVRFWSLNVLVVVADSFAHACQCHVRRATAWNKVASVNFTLQLTRLPTAGPNIE